MLTIHRTESNQRESPLLRLPPEIRRTIYGHLSDMTSYKPGREYNPRWSIECGVKALRQSCRQLEAEGREFKSAPTVLDLRTDFEQKDLEWLIRTGLLATITTIELSVTIPHSVFFPKWMGAAHEVFVSLYEDEWNTWDFRDGVNALMNKYRARLYPNIQAAWIHGFPEPIRTVPGSSYTMALKQWLQQPLLEVTYM